MRTFVIVSFGETMNPLNEGNWTFPSEKDFVCQLYHRLRAQLKQGATILTEYQTPSASRKKVDLFVRGDYETVGIEVKMNYDNLRYEKQTSPLTQKFDAMSDDNDNHTNFLVVIQGQDAHRRNNKANALNRLRQGGSDFSLLHYAECDNKAIGPISVKEAQELATRR